MKTENQVTGQQDRTIDIKLLAIDLDTCTRCVGTLANIETAIGEVERILDVTSTKLEFPKILLETEVDARKYRFVSSPTIRVNDRDIVFETLESKCDSCTDLCGCEEGTDCRIWPYKGEEYTEAPVGLIVESLMGEIFGDRPARRPESDAYTVPVNLQQFFAGKAIQQEQEAGVSACCSEETQQSCCESTTWGCQ